MVWKPPISDLLSALVLQLDRGPAAHEHATVAADQPSSKQDRLRVARTKAAPAAGWKQRLVRWTGLLALLLLLAPPLQALLLRYVDPPFTQTMLSVAVRHGLASGEWRMPAQTWRDLSQLPRHALVAAVSSEDRKFLYHHGFDLVAIRRAWASTRSGNGKKVIGGSTISQQVARNVFLWQHRSWLRKGLEAWYTVWLEAFCSKERILEVYLNVAEMGPMVFGVEAAGQHWFGKSALALSAAETAALVGMLPAPARWTPASPTVRKRAAWIRNAPARLPEAFAPESRRRTASAERRRR